MQTRLRQGRPASKHRRLPGLQPPDVWLCLWLLSRQHTRSRGLEQALQQRRGWETPACIQQDRRWRLPSAGSERWSRAADLCWRSSLPGHSLCAGVLQAGLLQGKAAGRLTVGRRLQCMPAAPQLCSSRGTLPQSSSLEKCVRILWFPGCPLQTCGSGAASVQPRGNRPWLPVLWPRQTPSWPSAVAGQGLRVVGCSNRHRVSPGRSHMKLASCATEATARGQHMKVVL